VEKTKRDGRTFKNRLRGHPAHRTRGRLGVVCLSCLFQLSAQAKIADFDLENVVQQTVARSEVPVDDTVGCKQHHSIGDVADDSGALWQGQVHLVRTQVAQERALAAKLRHEHKRIRNHAQKSHDAWMLRDLRKRDGFFEKRCQLFLGKSVLQHLHRHVDVPVLAPKDISKSA
jgi:hypothetical protein